jgi:hypothetical protein
MGTEILTDKSISGKLRCVFWHRHQCFSVNIVYIFMAETSKDDGSSSSEMLVLIYETTGRNLRSVFLDDRKDVNEM